MSSRDVALVSLVCDDCGDTYIDAESGPMVFTDHQQARHWASGDYGWAVHAGRDVCRVCRCEVHGEHGGYGWNPPADATTTDKWGPSPDCLIRQCEHCGHTELRETATLSSWAYDPILATLPATLLEVPTDPGLTPAHALAAANPLSETEPADDGEPVLVELSWHPSDPCVVRFDLHSDAIGPLTHSVGRRLLDYGRWGPTGTSAAAAWMRIGANELMMIVRIRVQIDLGMQEVSRFLRTTYQRVPFDGEHLLVATALHTQLAQILAADERETSTRQAAEHPDAHGRDEATPN